MGQRNAARLQEHQEWLEAHDRAMVAIDRKMDSLIANIDRFLQGRNVN